MTTSARPLLDAVYALARIGLIEVAKDTRNNPGVVANHATLLEQWRSSCEQQLADADKIAAEAKAKP